MFTIHVLKKLIYIPENKCTKIRIHNHRRSLLATFLDGSVTKAGHRFHNVVVTKLFSICFDLVGCSLFQTSSGCS